MTLLDGANTVVVVVMVVVVNCRSAWRVSKGLFMVFTVASGQP